MNEYRMDHTAVLLPSGEVLEIGGFSAVPTSTELYNPATGTFSRTANLNQVRDEGAGTVLLPDGVVLVTGGSLVFNGKSYFINSAELYH